MKLAARAKMDAAGMQKRDSGIAVKSQRVVMAPGVYPRKWGGEKA